MKPRASEGSSVKWRKLVDGGFAYCNANHKECRIKSRSELESEALEAMRKYSIKGESLQQAAKILAQTLHMLHQQNGGEPLNASLIEEVEHQVLRELFPSHHTLSWEEMESDYRVRHQNPS